MSNKECTYNVNNISNLIGQFKSVIKTYGKSENAVRLYKEHNRNLVNTGDIQQQELDFVYRLLGMRNTDVVKWGITLTRLNSFIGAMNYMICCSESQRQDCLRKLIEAGKINNTVRDYIVELYGLNLSDSKPTLDSYKNSSYGTFAKESNTAKNKSNLRNINNRNNLLDQLIDRYIAQYKINEFYSFYHDAKYAEAFDRFSEDVVNLIKDNPLEDTIDTSKIKSVPEQLFRVQNIRGSEVIMIALIKYFQKGLYARNNVDRALAQVSRVVQFINLDEEIINLYSQISDVGIYFKYSLSNRQCENIDVCDTLANLINNYRSGTDLNKQKFFELLTQTAGCKNSVKLGVYSQRDNSFEECKSLTNCLHTYSRLFAFIARQAQRQLNVISNYSNDMLDANCIV